MVRKTVESVGIKPGNRGAFTPFAELDPATRMDKAAFADLLAKIDSGLRALPATAQVRSPARTPKFSRSSFCYGLVVGSISLFFCRTLCSGCGVLVRCEFGAVQVAKQEGEYLAKLLGEGQVWPGEELPEGIRPFAYNHKGSLAYVGSDKAVMDTPQLGPLTGRGAGKS